MTAPRTAAGRALLSSMKGSLFGNEAGRDAILAIEAEAEQPWRDAMRLHATSPEHYAPAEATALPAGWRLTDEAEVTVEALARALAHSEGYTAARGSQYWLGRAEAILAALRGAS